MRSGISGKILVVDDDKDILFTAGLVLKGLFEKVDTLDRPWQIPEYLKACKYDVILLDMNFSRGSTSGREGLDWLGKILKIDPGICVLTTTAYGEINLAVQAMKNGAVDFIIKPWNREQLITSIRNVIEFKEQKECQKVSNKRSGESDPKLTRYPEIIGRSQAMSQILDMIKTVAPTDANVLIMGENGTGKEVAAWALHNASQRNNKSFVHVDLGAIPETLFEAELFGHKRGAFTDAKEDRAGRFETASGGTLFLDELGNLSLPLQAKILTAVQNRSVVRIGSNHPVPVNVRLISATNMPLYEMAESFEFRQDLLYRVNTVEITIPPLRERKEDIRPITDYYLKRFSDQYGKAGLSIADNARRRIEEYNWPGNIRELAHAIERAVILCKRELLTTDDFIFKTKPSSIPQVEEPSIRVEDYEKKAITSALNKHHRNLSKAADELGIARSTLYRKISHFGISD
jgi:DNA-binding NtrC family response regulator